MLRDFVVVVIVVCFVLFFIEMRLGGICVVGVEGGALRYWHLRRQMALDSSASQKQNNNYS